MTANLKLKLLALSQLITVSAIQTPLIAVSLGLLCANEITFSQENPPIIKLFFAFLGVFFVISHIMVLNDYYDYEIDKKKDAMQTLAVIPRRIAGVLAVILLGLGLLFAYLTSLTFLLISVFLVVLSAAYSMPPIMYKKIYPLSTIGEASGAYLLFWGGYGIFAHVDLRALLVSLIPFFILVIWRLKHEIRYAEFDAETGKKTFAVVHGIRKVNLLIRLCGLAIAVISTFIFLAGWFSFTFMFLLAGFLVFVALLAASSRVLALFCKLRAEWYWGYLYFLIVVISIYY